MAPGFDQICMSRPRIIYLDLTPASRLSSLLRRDAMRRDATRRDASGLVEAAYRGAFGIIGVYSEKTERKRRELERKTQEAKEKERGGGGIRVNGIRGEH